MIRFFFGGVAAAAVLFVLAHLTQPSRVGDSDFPSMSFALLGVIAFISGVAACGATIGAG